MKNILFSFMVIGMASTAFAGVTNQDVVDRFVAENPRCDFEFAYPNGVKADEIVTLTNGRSHIVMHTFKCSVGAYNVGSVFYFVYGEEYISKQNFPMFTVTKEGKLGGFETTDMIYNYQYNPQTKNLRYYAKARGIGDAFDEMIFHFEEGRFVLKKVNYDGTMDEKINPVNLFKVQ